MSIAAMLLMALLTWLFWSNLKGCLSNIFIFIAVIVAVLIFLFSEFH